LNIDSNNSSPSAIEEEPWWAVGTFEQIDKLFSIYLMRLPASLATKYMEERFLHIRSMYSSVIDNVLDGLVGNNLYASRTVGSNGLQYGNPHNITTRQEVTRWFGIGILFALNLAQLATSGVNDWGGGIWDFKNATGHHFVCDGTLRITSDYTSVNLLGLLILALLMLLVIVASYAIGPLLRLLISRLPEHSHSDFRRAFISQRLRLILQLHRSVVEGKADIQFTGTLDVVPRLLKHPMPPALKYGVQRRYEIIGEHEDEDQQALPGHQNKNNEAVTERGVDVHKFYATALRKDDNEATAWRLSDII
jgi:hypothetical protein